MQREPEVRVERGSYTPRDRLQEGRFNLVLNLRAVVPKDSYLFVGGLAEVVEDMYTEFWRKIEELLGRGAVDQVSIEKEILPIFDRARRGRRGGSTGFLSYDGKFAIPGSSLKGAIRSRVEYKLRPLPFGNALKSYSCYISQNPRGASASTNHAKFWGSDVIYSRRTCQPPNVCVTCDLFGAPSLSSRVLFSDAIMEKGRVEEVKELGREAARPGSEFRCQVYLVNADPVDLGLILAGTEVLTDKRMIIGAFKYRYNPKFGTKLRGIFYAGLLKFELDSYEIIAGKQPLIGGKDELIRKAGESLVQRFGDHIDIERGAV
ncbi:MAG: RAMP superfamily CRISPR-associated protein [Candidatus Korarchaeum sp.]